MLDPWQRAFLEMSMAERADTSWAAAVAALIASRQNGKNGIIEARELYGLTVLGEWIIHTAHLFKTTRESFQRLLGYVEANPDVKDSLDPSFASGQGWVASPASGYEMRFKGGGRIQFLARSRTSGKGLTGDLLVFDEAQDLDNDALGALLPTISARPGAQSWYTGSAPNAASEVFHRIRKRGRAGGEKRLAYMEFSADPDASLDDRDAWAQANPALGVRITEEAIEAERGSMDNETFARERLGISPDLADGGGIFTDGVWEACRDPKSGPVGPVSFALDVSPSRTQAAFAVAGDAGGGGVHVEVVDHRAGTDWLVERAKDLQAKWGGVLAVAHGSPAASLLVELEQAGVSVLEVSSVDHAKACGNFYDAVHQGQLRHLGQPELTIAVDGADRKFYGDTWLWSRRLSQVDITPLVAATLAKWAHDQTPEPVMAVPEVIRL